MIKYPSTRKISLNVYPHHLVVTFTSEREGVVVESDSKYHPVGKHSKGWRSAEDFTNGRPVWEEYCIEGEE